MLLLKIIISSVLGIIIYQDLKDREVFWFMFPILIGLLGFLHYHHAQQINFLYAVLINVGLLIVIMGLLYLYTLIKIKLPFFEEIFGVGDLLFFVALAIGFPTITFIGLFVFSLVFSLLVWFMIKKKAKHNTIPLAGYMSVFLFMTFITQWITNTLNLYLI